MFRPCLIRLCPLAVCTNACISYYCHSLLSAVVFMHPGDFTPVCTTELGKAASMEADFTKRNVKLVGFSCNDNTSHKAWIADIKAATGADVKFPLFCDPDRAAATDLGILDSSNKDAKGMPLTVRSVFVLKPDKTIALMMTYPASTGRHFGEILRVVDSVQLTATDSVATPVNWQKGDDVIVNFPLTDAAADEKFGKGGYRITEVPSESGKDIPKHYLRYTKDPSK
jgi:alkyl hydroperoxide reductase subunit AhpC